MSDLPISLQSQQAYARPLSGEELELLGKAAAALYSRSGTPLTQAVVETVKHAGLGPEQVRRIAEFANVEAYLQEFQKCGNDHRYVQFHGGPADVPSILRDLNDGGGGTVFDRGLADYSHAPVNVSKLASRNMDRLGMEDQKLASMFQSEDQALPYADPLGEAYALYTKLSSARELITHEMGEAESHYAGIVDAIFTTVKQAALEGVPLGHVVQAWATVTDEPEFIKAAFTVLTPMLTDSQVFTSLDQIGESLEKTAAGVVVDETHPLVGDFRQYCELIDKIACLRAARDEVTESMDHLGTFLRGAIEKTAGESHGDDVVNALERGAGALRSGWQGANRLSAAASEPVRRVTTALAGPLAGSLVGGAVKHAPKIGVGLVGESAYQHARYSPAFQGAKNLVLSRIPYTHPYMVRQYGMQMGAGP